MGFKITNKEAGTRVKYIILGFFGFYMIGPMRDWADTTLPWVSQNPVLFSVIGIALTLYFFDF